MLVELTNGVAREGHAAARPVTSFTPSEPGPSPQLRKGVPSNAKCRTENPRVYAGCLPCAKGTHVESLDAANHWLQQHWKDCSESTRFRPTKSGISPTERYAELEARGEERPRCDCHGEPMAWNREARYRNGGRWRCNMRDPRRSPARLPEAA